MSRSSFAIRCTKNVQKWTEPLFLPFYGPCKHIFVEYCLDFYVHLIKIKSLLVVFVLCFVGSFCSRIECEKRKAIWDACVAEITQDSGQKKDFDTQMRAVVEATGQYTQTDHVVSLIACLLPCISSVIGANFFWGTSLPSGNLLPKNGFRDSAYRTRCDECAVVALWHRHTSDCFLTGPSGERTPFRFLECDVQGGDANQIKGADAGPCPKWYTTCFQTGESPSASIYCLRTGFGRCRCSPSIDVFAASFCVGKQPKRDCVAFLAYKYGSAGSVSFDIIDVHVPNGNQSGCSLFCSNQSGEHRTNGMPRFVRQPDGPQSYPPVCEGTARKYKLFASIVYFSHTPCCIAHTALPSGSIRQRGVWANVG